MLSSFGLVAAMGVLCLCLGCAPRTTVRVIAFNDFHGNLNSPGNFEIQAARSGAPAVSKSVGGVDYLAGYVNLLKQGHPRHVVVSAGDLTGASPLISAAYHDEGAIEALNRLGLEFNAVGNHEFDNGMDELLRKQHGGCHPEGVVGRDTCMGASSPNPVPASYPFEGARFKYLSANVVFPETGKTLFPPYAVKIFDTPAGRVKVGFIGMTLRETPDIVPSTGIRALKFRDEAMTVNALAPELQAQGVEAIVVLLHQGGIQGRNGPNAFGDCSLASGGRDDPGALQPLRTIVSQLDDAVDLVVSGHTHQAYLCRLPNRKGRNIPVTQAGNYGRFVTTVDLDIDPISGNVVAADFSNIVVDRENPAVTPDGAIKTLVDAYAAHISPIARQVVASIAGPVTNHELPARFPGVGATGEKPTGDLVADAMLNATASPSAGGAQIAFVNPGGIRAGYHDKSKTPAYPYDLTYEDVFTAQPFGNQLVTMTLTAQQIKDLLEMQFPGDECLTPSGINRQTQNRVLQPSRGLSFAWSAKGGNCARIVEASLTHPGTDFKDRIVAAGRAPNPGKSYRVTVNAYMAAGGDAYAVFSAGRDVLFGGREIDATIEYLERYKNPNPPYDPAQLEPRIRLLP